MYEMSPHGIKQRHATLKGGPSLAWSMKNARGEIHNECKQKNQRKSMCCFRRTILTIAQSINNFVQMMGHSASIESIH